MASDQIAYSGYGEDDHEEHQPNIMRKAAHIQFPKFHFLFSFRKVFYITV